MNMLRQKNFLGSGLKYLIYLMLSMSFAASTASAAQTNCTPSNVAVFDTRVHVKCVESVGDIQYFAVSTADNAKAARILTLINSAIVTGRQLFIWYTPSDLSGAAIGCQTSDCRLIEGLGFWE